MIDQTEDLRRRVFNSLRSASMAMGVLLWAVSAYRNYLVQDYLSVVIFSAFLAVAVYAFYSASVPLKVRYMFVSGIVFVIGLSVLSLNGPFSTTTLWFTASCAVTGVFFGRRAALWLMAASFAIIIAFGIAALLLVDVWTPPGQVSGGYLLEWTLNVIFLMFVTIIPGTYLIESVDTARERDKWHRSELVNLNKQLRDANRALTTMNDTIANSLSKPLRRIHFNTELLEEESTDLARGQELTAKIFTDIKHIFRLISNAQRLSQINRHELNRRVVKIKPLAETVLHNLNPDGHKNLVCDQIDDFEMFADRELLFTLLEIIINSLLFHLHEGNSAVCKLEKTTLEDLPAMAIILMFPKPLAPENDPDYVPLYSPFLKETSAVTGTELILAQHIVHLHGGEMVLANDDTELRIVFNLGSQGS